MATGELDHVQLHFVENVKDVTEFREWAFDQPRDVLGIDTETTGLSPDKDHVRLIQFGDLNDGWAIPWERWSGAAVEVLDAYTGDLVLHNSKFDIRHIQSDLGRSVRDWPWHRTHDTMGMAHIDDSQRSKALKTLTAQKIDGRASAGQKTLDDGMHRNKWNWETVPLDFPPYWQYAALDPVLTAYLYKYYSPDIFANQRSLYDLEMGATRVAAKMEEYGILVDLGYSVKTAAALREYSDSARDYLKNQYGIANPTPTQLKNFFESAQVWMPEKTTASGAQAMDKEVLSGIDHEVATTTLNIRKAEKLSGTYLENFPRFADQNSIIHPGINTMAARTGRMSITEPALQTLPKKDPTIRKAFIPREGNVLISCDYDQIEARLTAHFANDPGLIAAFNDPGDFFCNIATPMFGYEIKKGMRERDWTKGVVYGKVYGASVMKMALTAGVAFDQMQRTNTAFDTNFQGVSAMQHKIIELGKQRARESDDGRGYVITPYGRVLKADRGKEYTLVNYLIQCHASEILKRAMVDLDAVLPEEVKMLVPVHDEVIFDCPADMAEDIRVLIEDTMKDDNYAVPITAGSDIMIKSWGEKTG